jgi:uncharacterized damage-inducible protein DinB
MDKETITLFVRYNQVANQAMDEIIGTLNPAEWNKNLGGYFESVHGLCSHLYICDFNWLKRYSQFRSFEVLGETFFSHKPYSYDEVLFDDMTEYLTRRPELDNWFIRFVDELTDSDLAGIFKYTASNGTTREWSLGNLVMQCLNHDTFSRGMISLYLEMLEKENDFGSLMRVLKKP